MDENTHISYRVVSARLKHHVSTMPNPKHYRPLAPAAAAPASAVANFSTPSPSSILQSEPERQFGLGPSVSIGTTSVPTGLPKKRAPVPVACNWCQKRKSKVLRLHPLHRHARSLSFTSPFDPFRLPPIPFPPLITARTGPLMISGLMWPIV